MQIFSEKQLDYSDVLIKPRRSSLSSRKEVNILRDYKFKWCPKVITGTGIMQANMGTIGNFKLSKKMIDNGLFACLHKYHKVDDLITFYKELLSRGDDSWQRCLLAVGLKDDGVEKLRSIYKELGIQVGIKFDVPNGYIPQVKQRVMELRAEFSDMFLMVGNVVTGDITEDLILSGADCVAAGIGPGGQCITRKQTGCGRPQWSAVVECADAAHQVGGMVCADGGVTEPGDLGKAFGAGADFIMIGSMFAGTDEADGDIVSKFYSEGEYERIPHYDTHRDNEEEVDVFFKPKEPIVTYTYEPKIVEKKFKLFYGMSSTLAQETFGSGKPSYRASEGRVSLVPYSGPIDDKIEELLGGLRSTMTYLGAKKLKDIPKQCVFYKVNNQLNRTYEKTTIGK